MKRLNTSLAPAVSALLAALLAALLTGLLAAVSVLLVASAASALPVVGHGYGHTWRNDGRSWLGSHRLSDGNLGLCLQVQFAPPEGADAQYQLGTNLGWVSADDAARLAYIGRWWASAADNNMAASAQLATWGITGLGSHDMGWYAQRANDSDRVVLARAVTMRETMDAPAGASRGVTAKLTLAVPGAAAGTVRSDLVVDYLGGGPAKLPSGRHTGTLTLKGAAFADGSTVQGVQNGQTLAITPADGTALSDVTADVVYTDLPYGTAFYVAKAPTGIQSLLVPPPGGIAAQAHAHGGDISPLPFAPAVQTETSAAETEVGAHLFDALELKLAVKPRFTGERDAADAPGDSGDPGDSDVPGDGDAVGDSTAALVPPTTLSEWGVYRDGEGALQPVPVTIRSTLWGPFASPPARQADIPLGSKAVCRVSVVAENGPGPYRTPDCTLPAEGYYVWTDTIDPADTPVSQGGDRITAWSSPFGVAEEVTLAVTPPPPPVVPATPPPTPPATPPTAPPVAPPTSPPATPPTPETPRTMSATPAATASLASTGRDSDTITPWLAAASGIVALGSASFALAAQQRARRRRT
ncbi:hypothetical protein [Subtercola boreus]|uniref:Uncharacterized protein n=1 Tax=Subtercola boreus TaxID=120213 RepID=A0A3E0W8C0_9MICO|nr:hypothetical protein [Subtercola boreus]RFA19382.1 hypothetical protein B7R24_12115 [Subtercola boreus]RFA19643.1 hypothetical protein B7R23_12095 [Subtercola boreus]RFA26008.1 hypothetical protein B7R25_12215 [Subtercola boreus]